MLESFYCRHIVITTWEIAVYQRDRLKRNSITNHICWCIQPLIGFVRVWGFLVCTVSHDEQQCVVWAKAKQSHLEADVIKSECAFACACCPVAACLSLWVNLTIPVHRPKPSTLWPRGLTKPFMFWSRDNFCCLYSVYLKVCVTESFMHQEDSGYDLPPCYFLSGTNQITALHFTRRSRNRNVL